MNNLAKKVSRYLSAFAVASLLPSIAFAGNFVANSVPGGLNPTWDNAVQAIIGGLGLDALVGGYAVPGFIMFLVVMKNLTMDTIFNKEAFGKNAWEAFVGVMAVAMVIGGENAKSGIVKIWEITGGGVGGFVTVGATFVLFVYAMFGKDHLGKMFGGSEEGGRNRG